MSAPTPRPNAWQQRRMLAEHERWMEMELAKHAHEVAKARRHTALLDVMRDAALDGELRTLGFSIPERRPRAERPRLPRGPDPELDRRLRRIGIEPLGRS